jgi:hypothetical protein
MDWDKQTIDEWNLLGFYYEYDESLKQWRFFGSKHGLYKLSALIKDYAGESSNEDISEHKHIGPYNYLKIMTWNEPIVTDKYIAGSLQELLGLSTIMDDKISSVKIGQIVKILAEYSSKSTATLLFIIMSDDFIPSSIEFS